MASESPSTPSEEADDLLRYIVAKSEDIQSPFNVRQLCLEYQEKKGSGLALTGLIRRIERFRQKIPKMDNIDNTMKVKLMFALSASVDDSYLDELKKDAEVELDARNRITKYERADGQLKLSGKHSSRIPSLHAERDKSMIDFLAEQVQNATTPTPVSVFAREFKEATGATENANHLRDRYVVLRSQIAASTDFDQATKVKMMFVTSTPVSAIVLEKLRETAIVYIDEHSRITNYKAHDGSLELNGKHRRAHAKRNGKKCDEKLDADDLDEDGDEENMQKKDMSDSKHNSKASKRNHPPDNDDFFYNMINQFVPVADVKTPSRVVSEVSFSVPNILLAANVNIGEPSPVRIKLEPISDYSQETQSDAFNFLSVPGSDKNRKTVQDQQCATANVTSSDEVLSFPTVPEFSKPTDSIAAKKILKLLRNLVLTLDSPLLSGILLKVENQMKTAAAERIPTENLHPILRTALLALINSGKPMTLWQGSTSLRGFLMMFCCSLINIETVALKDIQDEIKEAVRMLGNEDRSISIESVQMVLGTVLLTISS